MHPMFTLHRGSKCPVNQKIPPEFGGIPHSINFLGLGRFQHWGCFNPESGGWRLVAVDVCSLPGCVGSHILSI